MQWRAGVRVMARFLEEKHGLLGRSSRGRWRYLAIAPAVALAATGLTVGSSSAAAASNPAPPGTPPGRDTRHSPRAHQLHAAPRMESAFGTSERLPRLVGQGQGRLEGHGRPADQGVGPG